MKSYDFYSFITSSLLTVWFLSGGGGVIAQLTPNRHLNLSSIGGDNRTNVCQRYQRIENGTVKLENALSGLNLTILVSTGQYVNSEKGIIKEDSPGLIIEILDELAERANFSWNNSFDIVGDEDQGRWEDVLLKGVENYDVYADWWVHSINRFENGVTFPAGWFTSADFIMVARKDGNSKELQQTDFIFLKPFQPFLWYFIIITTFFSAYIFQFLQYCEATRNGEKKKFNFLPAHNIYLAVMGITQSKYPNLRNNGSIQVASFSFAFWTMVIVTIYTANLASYFVIKKTNTKFNTINDVLDEGKKICLWNGTAAQTYTEVLRDFYDLEKLFVFKDNETALYEGAWKGDCFVALTTVQSWEINERKSAMNPGCALEKIGKKIGSGSEAGFATTGDYGVKCTSLVRDVLNIHLIEMKLDGWLKEKGDKFLESIPAQKCYAKESVFIGNEGQATVFHMYSVFAFHWSLMSIALLMAIWRRCSYADKKKLMKVKKDDSSITNERQQHDINSTIGMDKASQDDAMIYSSSLTHQESNRQLKATISQLRAEMNQKLNSIETKIEHNNNSSIEYGQRSDLRRDLMVSYDC